MENVKSINKTFSYSYLGTAVLHIIYMGVFCFEKLPLFIVMNLIFAIIYAILGIFSRKSDSLINLFRVCAVVMVAFICTHYIFFGPTFGFQYLSIGSLPLIYYISYMLDKKVDFSKKVAIAVFVSFLVVSLACQFIKYPLIAVRPISRTIVVGLNAIVAFVMSIVFLTYFVKKITEDAGALVNKNSVLEKSANIDALTGLRNRRTIESYIKKVFQNAKGNGSDFSFLMCDIDNFKKVNDTYGHDCGDQVLKKVAEVIKNEIRPEDMAFRWGGEEILIIINAKGYVAKNVAERCRASIEQSSIIYNNQEIKVTITIGGSTYYQGATRDSMITRADENLYTGKNSGKNQVVM